MTKTFIRPIYAGNAFAKVTSNDSLRVVTVRASAFDPVACKSQVDIEHQQTSTQSPVVELVAIDKTVSERPELTAAEIVISGGRGVGSKENFELIEKVADKLGAAIGASRAAVDAGLSLTTYKSVKPVKSSRLSFTLPSGSLEQSNTLPA